jgi:hypothetical protein
MAQFVFHFRPATGGATHRAVIPAASEREAEDELLRRFPECDILDYVVLWEGPAIGELVHGSTKPCFVFRLTAESYNTPERLVVEAASEAVAEAELRDQYPGCKLRNVVHFEFRDRDKSLLPVGTALLAGVAAGVLVAVAFEDVNGRFITIRLPAPLGLDLLLCSRSEPYPKHPTLDNCFEISASNVAKARRRLEGPLAAALIFLHGRYLVRMDDESIEFGPLLRPPEEFARDLVAVTEAVMACWGDTSDDVANDAVASDDSPFCFYCGTPVSAISAVCPRCGGDLTEDERDS